MLAEHCRSYGCWTGGGFSPSRLDRNELRARLAGAVPAFVADELADAFEASAMASRETARERNKAAEKAAPRGRQPQPSDQDEE